MILIICGPLLVVGILAWEPEITWGEVRAMARVLPRDEGSYL